MFHVLLLPRRPFHALQAALLFFTLVLGSCRTPSPTEMSTAKPVPTFALSSIIPMPDSVKLLGGSFVLNPNANIYVEPGTVEARSIGQFLADIVGRSTGYNLQVLASAGAPPRGNIYLTTVGGDPTLGEEGYVLTVTQDLATVVAYQPAGLFRGIQTVRQLLPPSIESSTIQPGPWGMAAVTIRDSPRFVWRGTMLDLSRHFFGVQDVKRYLDLMAYYKLNRFHLHLTDDQGWRIVINSWPNLATYGGSTQVGGATGGYLTQAEYSEIVAYAQLRYITVIPEIDVPGHTNAALASYAGLNCDGVARSLYTGIGVGFSALCVSKETTYTFVDDVIRELSALTPGPFIHIGGDEAFATAIPEYVRFIERVQTIVQSYGKQMIGWEEIAQSRLLYGPIVQHWYSNVVQGAAQQGTKVIMSPASKAYLDMKYDNSTTLGQDWAGYIEVKDAYTWDPATQVSGVAESNILGLEAPLWTETIQTIAEVEYMAFPRLAGYAEIGWSREAGRNWDEYKIRLGEHGSRLTALGVKFYRTPEVPWK